MKTLSMGQQRKIQEGIMAPLNSTCNVINSFKLEDEQVYITATRCYESIFVAP